MAAPSFVPHVFTAAQIVDIRRFCGYPPLGDGTIVQPAPWIVRVYQVLEHRLTHMSEAEANVVINTYLANLSALEQAIPATSDNLDTAQAAVWVHNPDEITDRARLFTEWRTRLCDFLGIEHGPYLTKQKTSIRFIV